MLKYIAENQTRLKLTDKPAWISLEMRMACGLGVCYAAHPDEKRIEAGL